MVRSPLKGIRHPMADVDKRRWRVLFKALSKPLVPVDPVTFAPGSQGMLVS